MNTALQINIKKKLTAKNMTAAELERRTGIPHAVVNILHGRSKNPSIKTAQAIAKELGCTVEDLFTEDQDSNIHNPKTSWNSILYAEVFAAVNSEIVKHNLQPTPEAVGGWLAEAYHYAIGNVEQKLDLRFVQWLLQRK